MSKNQINIVFFYIITFFVYTQGFWERFTPVPAQPIEELLIWVLALFSYRPVRDRSFVVFCVVVAVGLFSSVLTLTMVPYLKFMRFWIYFYILYSIFRRLNFSKQQFNHYFAFVIAMILLQGIASVYHIFILGERHEYNVGFMSSLGGTTATVFPLFVISVLVVVFCFWRDKKGLLLFVLLFVSAVLVGYSSGKRAIYFVIPSFIVAISVVTYFFYPRNVKQVYYKKIIILALLMVLCVPIYFYGMRNAGGFRYGLTGDETNIEVLRHSLEYAEEYEDREKGEASAGRSGTTMLILSHVVNDPTFLLYGTGFGSVKDESTMDNLGFVYGIVGITRDIISGGLIFALLMVLFFIYIIFGSEYEERDFIAKFMRWVVFAVFVFTHFGYSANFTVSLKINMMMIPLLALLNCEKYREIKRYYYQKYFKLNYVKNKRFI